MSKDNFDIKIIPSFATLESVNESDTETRVLPITYKNSGLTLNQEERTQKAAIYKEADSDMWEVFLIKISKASTIETGGKPTELPDREILPSDSDFGVSAWSFNNHDDALNKFNEIK